MVPQPWKEKEGKRAPNPTLGPAILLPSIYPQDIDTDTPTRLSSHHPALHSQPPRCYICSHFLFHLFLVCPSS
ncbi:hypothetical protein C4D60_Mb10t15240 [Musa balbisiana]|uniref:Uncharacterized protein n=1 Tax=Musa balbisiana TaxID=52838 RepID=A0A4S8IX85_MUSBA|nr:hypothetical protein C4D60_Mb10t15240 [Musa balbisiana]